MRTLLIVGTALTLLTAPALPAVEPLRETSIVDAEIRRIAASAGGEVGLAAWRLDGAGPRLLLNPDHIFPMASSYKVAVAGAVLSKIDAGTISLEKMMSVTPDDYVESDVIATGLIHPGVSLSVQNLMELMLSHSDNTATDILMAAAGGPKAVTAWIRGLGITGLRIDRDTAGILRDFFKLRNGVFSEALAAARKADPKIEERGSHPNPDYDDDPRDTASPIAMAELLTKIFSYHALSPASTKVLIGMMERCHTGDARIRARLPAGTVVADKTGTLGGSLNDVGVITLPEDKGQLVAVIFIKKSDLPFAEREKVIADLSRAIYDYFLFNDAK